MKLRAAVVMLLAAGTAGADEGAPKMAPSWNLAKVQHVSLEQVNGGPKADGTLISVSFQASDSLVFGLSHEQVESDPPDPVETDRTTVGMTWLYGVNDNSQLAVGLGATWADSGSGTGSGARFKDEAFVASLGWRSRPWRRVSYSAQVDYTDLYANKQWGGTAAVEGYLTPAFGIAVSYSSVFDSELSDDTGIDQPDTLRLGIFFDFSGGKGLGFND